MKKILFILGNFSLTFRAVRANTVITEYAMASTVELVSSCSTNVPKKIFI